jgi:intergrase/recombinase
MGRSEIISGDNEIISKIFGDPEFQGINLYATTTHETNKNAIIERFIRTLKNYMLKILTDPNVKFNRFVDFTTHLIQKACIMYNNSYHRIIQARPIDVFEGRDTNKQEIIRFEYVSFQKGPILEWAVFYTKPDILSPLWVFRCPNIKISILIIKIIKMRSTLHILFICPLES